MPHLQFEINKKVSDDSKEEFVNEIRNAFAQIMDTGTDHIAISIREYDKYSLTIGRAEITDDICLMNLDIRVGRTIEKRRELALSYMEIVKENLGIPGLIEVLENILYLILFLILESVIEGITSILFAYLPSLID